MNVDTIFNLTLIILCIGFVSSRWLNWLNTKAMSPSLPDKLKGIYEESEYARFQEYHSTNERMELISATIDFVLMLVFLCIGGFGWLNDVVTGISDNAILQGLLFFGLLGLAATLTDIPFEWYDTFRVEERFGFNKTTQKTFWLDLLKGTLVTGVIGGGLYAAITAFWLWVGDSFWLWAWGAITLFMLFMSLFYSQVIVPLFNKQKPLEDGDLRRAIEDFAQKVHFKISNIYVIDGSKRSTKANAYFTGFGRHKRVVLYDTLISELTQEEILAVLAHEIGHCRHGHTFQFFGVSVFQTGFMLWIFSLAVSTPELSMVLGGSAVSFHLGLLAFALLYSPVSMLTGLLTNIWSRSNEYQADRYATRHGLGDTLISGLKKISVKALSNLTPHPIFEFVNYSHPSLLHRIKHIQKHQI